MIAQIKTKLREEHTFLPLILIKYLLCALYALTLLPLSILFITSSNTMGT